MCPSHGEVQMTMADDEDRENEASPLNISFSGCGFLGIYHIGVIQCLRENAPTLIPRFNFVAGASAGALASLVLLSNCSIEKVCKAILETAEAARKPLIGPLSTSFDVMSILDTMFDDLLPPNIHRICNGRLQVSLTGVSHFTNLMASQFNTRLELIRALKATCFIPVWAGFGKHSYRGELYMDGGMTNNLPTDFPGETITVSPFSGEADICPSDQREGWDMSVNISGTSVRMTLTNAFRMKSALFPPKIDVLDRMFQGGYRDCLSFLKRRGLMDSVDVIPQEISAVAMCHNSVGVSDCPLKAAGDNDDDDAPGYVIFKMPKMSVHVAQEVLSDMTSALLEHASSSYAKVLSPSLVYMLSVIDVLLKQASSSCIRPYIADVQRARSMSTVGAIGSIALPEGIVAHAHCNIVPAARSRISSDFHSTPPSVDSSPSPPPYDMACQQDL
ncbi:patatin-like phospholipase domain-containing protein 2 [Sycon ciliatum]|uniref:patatin-like phospholipase domain-containing protein 2 n=1 Tax=Sycon ciliatum TaxID=27933 RepID=UPI0031F63488